jgi:hypothetical protein
MTTFCCLEFETLQTCRAKSPYIYPPGRGRPGFTPRHWVPFSSPPKTSRATVDVFDPAFGRVFLLRPLMTTRGRTTQKTAIIVDEACLPHSCLTIDVGACGNVFTESLPSNGCTNQNILAHATHMNRTATVLKTCSLKYENNSLEFMVNIYASILG